MRHWLFLSPLLPLYLAAQTDSAVTASAAQQEPGSLYIKYFYNRLNISTGTQINNAEFYLSYPALRKRFEVSPEVTAQQFVKMEFRQIVLRYSFSLFPLTPQANAPTNYRKEFGFSFGIKQFSFDVSRQNARGYFIRNSEDLLAGSSLSGTTIQLPDLRTRVYAFQMSYNTNSHFSLGSLSNGKELQTRSAASFLPGTSFYHIHFFQENQTPKPGLSSDDYIIDWNINLPLAATLVFPRNWYLTGIAGPIVGLSFLDHQSYDANLQRISNRSTLASVGYYLRGGFGVTGQKWFAGVEAYNTRYGSGKGADREARFFYGAKLYVGFRLSPPKVLKKTAELLPFQTPQ